ncbi:MAG: glycosyltransferase [Lentisphaeria bacterium]|nr:glycosyltransferase [Lentisphaeria bacterium]
MVPAYNEENFLPACLQSIQAAAAAVSGFAGEILVVDNHSTDATARVAESFGVKVVSEPVNQISRARNAGAARAKGTILIFVDADTRISVSLLARTLTTISAGGVCGGGALIGTTDSVTPGMSRVIRTFNRVFTRFGYAAGAYVFCLREGWDAVGGFSHQVYASEEIWFVRSLKRWGRARGLRFVTIPEPFDTSMRKSRWYSEWYLFIRGVGILLCPFLLKSKRWCALWYRRPRKGVETGND